MALAKFKSLPTSNTSATPTAVLLPCTHFTAGACRPVLVQMWLLQMCAFQSRTAVSKSVTAQMWADGRRLVLCRSTSRSARRCVRQSLSPGFICEQAAAPSDTRRMLARQCRGEETGRQPTRAPMWVSAAGLAGGEISDYDLRVSVLGATVDGDG